MVRGETPPLEPQAAPTEENLESLENLLGNIAAIAPGACRQGFTVLSRHYAAIFQTCPTYQSSLTNGKASELSITWLRALPC